MHACLILSKMQHHSYIKINLNKIKCSFQHYPSLMIMEKGQEKKSTAWSYKWIHVGNINESQKIDLYCGLTKGEEGRASRKKSMN